MKFKSLFYLPVLIVLFLAGCGRCDKLMLDQADKEWVNHFKEGQRFLFKSAAGQTDTLEIIGIRDYYTPCNKIELSKFQYEIYTVLFRLRSNNNYNGDESSISITTQEWKQKIPYIYLGNLGPYRNDLNNKLPVAMDTVLKNVSLKSVFYYARGFNTEEYGANAYFKNFFWCNFFI